MTLATLKNLKCPMKHCELFWFTIIPTLQEAIHKVCSRVGCGNKNGYSMATVREWGTKPSYPKQKYGGCGQEKN